MRSALRIERSAYKSGHQFSLCFTVAREHGICCSVLAIVSQDLSLMPRIMGTVIQCNSSGAGQQVFVRVCLCACMHLLDAGKLLSARGGRWQSFIFYSNVGGSFSLVQYESPCCFRLLVCLFACLLIKQCRLSRQMGAAAQLRLSLWVRVCNRISSPCRVNRETYLLHQLKSSIDVLLEMSK